MSGTRVSAAGALGEHRQDPLATLWVIVPALDEEACLGKLLERVRPRGHGRDLDRADALVVVDGGSRDRTRELAREAGATLLDAPRGRGSQLAAGAEHALRAAARSADDVLLFLHADTRPGPGALREVRRAFREEPRLVSSGMRQRIAAQGRLYRTIERAADWRVRRLGLVWGDSGLAVRASAYQAVGGFAPLAVFEDVELTRKLRRLGRPRWLADAELEISARRWERDGPLRRTLGNWMLSLAYMLGVPPAWLARRYSPHTTPTGSDSVRSTP